MLHFPLYFNEELDEKAFVKTNDVGVQFFVRFGTLRFCVLLADNQETMQLRYYLVCMASIQSVQQAYSLCGKHLVCMVDI